MTILERILTAVLIPALVMLTVPHLGPVITNQQADVDGPSTVTTRAIDALGMVLTGTSTQENQLYTLTLEAPDAAGVNQSVTVSATLEAKTELEFAALTLELPEGMSSSSPQLAEFDQNLSAGEALTGEFSVQATEAGSFTLTLNARGKPPETESQSLATSVTLRTGEAPTAQFTVSPQQPEAEQQVTFDASGSSAAQGEIASYRWEFGDGDTSEGANRSTVTHTFSEEGTYQVTLTVTDDQGLTGSTAQTVNVGPANDRPQATFSISTQEPKAGRAITFDGSGSNDPDGQIQNYRWTLGDGTVLEGADQATITHTYQEPGNYRVTLVVTDNEGATSQPRTMSVNVERAPTIFEQVPTAVWIGVGVAAVAGVVYVLTTQTGGEGADGDGQPAAGEVQSRLQNEAQDFISRTNVPFEGLTGVARQAQVQTLDRAQWVRQLLDRALIIHTQDGFSIKRYGAMSESEQDKFNARADELDAGSLLGFVSDRVSPGDTIYKLTWEQSNGETVESWAVVSSDGRLKLDTLISFFPLDP